MKKKFRTPLLVLTFISVFFLIKSNQYVKFKPITYDTYTEEFKVDEMHISDNFYPNLEKVLSHYDEDYIKRKGAIYIKLSLYNNKNLCWNYSGKATNKIWLHNNYYNSEKEE